MVRFAIPFLLISTCILASFVVQSYVAYGFSVSKRIYFDAALRNIALLNKSRAATPMLGSNLSVVDLGNKSAVSAQQFPHQLELFRSCDPSIFTLAIFSIDGRTTSGKFSNITSSPITMIITDNYTGKLSGKILLGNSSLDYGIAGRTKPLHFNIQHVTTQCVSSLVKALPARPDLAMRTPSINITAPLIISKTNPPVQYCHDSNQSMYIIKTIAPDLRILNDLAGNHHMTLMMTVDLNLLPQMAPETFQKSVITKSPLISGKLIVDNNEPINVIIREIDTLCALPPRIIIG